MSLTDLLIGVGREFNVASDDVVEKYESILVHLKREFPLEKNNWYERQAQTRLVNYYKAYKRGVTK